MIDVHVHRRYHPYRVHAGDIYFRKHQLALLLSKIVQLSGLGETACCGYNAIPLLEELPHILLQHYTKVRVENCHYALPS